MADEQQRTPPEMEASMEERTPDHGHLSLLVGGAAALLGGGLWALIVKLTNMELGYVAWGVGVLVGVAIAKTTPRRGRGLAAQGAGLAAVGLVFGKLLIIQFIALPSIKAELNDDAIAVAATWNLRDAKAFPAELQARVDAVVDTLSDTLWTEMVAEGRSRVTGLAETERAALADQYVERLADAVGFWGRLSWTLSPWDLLWFGLALSTAWRMLAKHDEEPAGAPA